MYPTQREIQIGHSRTACNRDFMEFSMLVVAMAWCMVRTMVRYQVVELTIKLPVMMEDDVVEEMCIL